MASNSVSANAPLGICWYCGRLDWMTRDHKTPRRLRQPGVQSRHATTVPACWKCQVRKGDKAYDDFRAWLATDAGYAYVRSRHEQGPGTNRIPLRACEVPRVAGETLVWLDTSPDGRERHFCASHKACGVLRRRLLVLGDGPTSVWKPLGLVA